MRIGSRYLSYCHFCPTLLILFFGCSDPDVPSLPGPSTATDYSDLIREIKSVQSNDFVIKEVVQEDDSIRVNIVQRKSPDEIPELRRLTLNALFKVQLTTGKNVRLSVWNWEENAGQFTGYAFYSTLDKSYHFKTLGDFQ